MPSKDPEKRSQAARIAAATRWGKKSPQIKELQRDLAAEKLEAYVSRVVAAAPALTPEQLARIAVLLRPAGGGA
ncbi:hypothetical protein ACQCSX_08710 [Pseudarthrobacter sp. P1]|uniref:hypothetical protein n=1 Tax=Pseudarthrobacter sp. P1 TaxID=3418418 RepID=UPI003CED848B